MSNANGTEPKNNMIDPGVYTAEPLGETWSELVEGKDQCAISFKIDDGPFKGHSLPWWGSFKAGEAFAITKKALDALQITFDADGASNITKLAKQVRIGVQHKPQQRYNGDVLETVMENGSPKMIPQITFVGGGAYTAKPETDATKIAEHRKRMAAMSKTASATTSEGLPMGPDGKVAF